MVAIVFDQYGGPEVLRQAEQDPPSPGPDQVRLRVRAAGVNPIDSKIRNGWMDGMIPTSFPAIPGIEAAGVVDEVGERVTNLAPGDEVFGFTVGGGYATYALADTVVRKPAELSWAQAAALPVSAETADRALDLLAVKDGETLLVHGAAGGVGSAAVQLAIRRGARVIGTASEPNHDYLRSLGAVPMRYGDGLLDRVRALAPEGVDAVFDVAGKGALPDSIELRGGTTDRIVTIADPTAADHGVQFTSKSRRSAEALAEYARLAVAGQLQIPVDRTFPLADAAAAMEQSETGHGRGRIILLTAGTTAA